MSKQPPPAPIASAIGPCPTIIQIVGRPGTGSLPRTIAPRDHPPLCGRRPDMETARYRLKHCLKGPLSPNQPTNHQWQLKEFLPKKHRIANLSQRLRGSLQDGKAPLSVLRRRPSIITNDFSSETIWPIVTKFNVASRSRGGGGGGRKSAKTVWVTSPKWPPRPYMAKPEKSSPEPIDR